jgi:hypothetical protein
LTPKNPVQLSSSKERKGWCAMARTIANLTVSPSKVSGRLATLHRVLEEEGLLWEDFQKPIDDPELRRRLVRFWKSGGFEPTTSQKLAKAIMPAGCFFGPEEWLTHFSGKVKFTKSDLARISEIPWSEEELRNPIISQPHFLFLGITRLDSKPLDLPAWHELYSGSEHPKFYLDWYLTHGFAKGTCRFRWYLMPGIVEGSNNLSYDCQVDLLPDEYEVPNAPERVTANILYYLLNKKYLDTDYWARTCDLSDGGYRVRVRGDSGDGLGVNGWDDSADVHIGLAASRKS